MEAAQRYRVLTHAKHWLVPEASFPLRARSQCQAENTLEACAGSKVEELEIVSFNKAVSIESQR